MSTAVDILAVAAHPDDAEIGCGGALLIAADAGLAVAIVDLTAGEMATRGSRAQRDEERRRASSVLGLRERIGLSLPDTMLGSDPSHRDALVNVIRDRKPRIVLAPHPDDRHPDHVAAGRLAREACFLAGVAKIGRGEPHRPRHLFEYMIHHPFEPSFVIDVTAVWERRAAAVAAYQSQFEPGPSPSTEIGSGSFLERLRDRAGYFGAMIGVARGEPFLCRAPLGLPSLPDYDGGRIDGQPSYRMYV